MYRTPIYFLEREFQGPQIQRAEFARFIYKAMGFFNIKLVKTE